MTHHAYPSFSTNGVEASKGWESISVQFTPAEGLGVTHISTLSTEEMPGMPLPTTCQDDLPFNRGLAISATRAEELVEVQMTVEPERFRAVLGLALAFDLFDLFATSSSLNAVHPVLALVLRLGVECDTLEAFATVEADEAFRVESLPSSTDDAPGNS